MKVMRLKIFLTSLAVLIAFSVRCHACSNLESPPSEYLMFRVYDPSVVMTSERGVTQLAESNDPEVKSYLALARSCEKLRNMYTSKWYYPTKGDDVVLSSLEEVLDEALAYKGTQLKDRYALQAARAMFTLGKYTEMIDWWAKVRNDIQDEAIQKCIQGYVAGALFRTGAEEKALEYYTSIGDIGSIVFCLKKRKDYKGDRTTLEYLSYHFPDNPYILLLLQEYITRLEAYSDYFLENGTTDACYQMCMKASSKSKSPAPWLYSAAFLKNQMGQPYVASNILTRAEKCQTSVFLQESMKVLRIMIDAQIYPYNKAYEGRLLEDLVWLDKKILGNITQEVKEKTAGIYDLKFCYSYYYWNDMMRRLILGTVCPRMIEAGKAPLAMLLANYADNRLMMSVNQIEIYKDGQTMFIGLDEYRKSKQYRNDFDFSNHYFRMMDTSPLNHLVKYESLLSNPSSPIEQFLQKRCYAEPDYVWDLIGTRYAREMKYGEAVKYLSKVSEGYEDRLNTSSYMNFNPFEIKTHYLRKSHSYKLDFVRKMVDYEQIVQNCIDGDIKGEAMIRMGMGIRSSFMFCWALTHYSKSEYNPWFEDKYTLDKIEYANTLIETGLKCMNDPEMAVRYYKDLCQWRTAVERFPETEVAEEIRTSCDNIVNYSYNRPKARETGAYVNRFCW